MPVVLRIKGYKFFFFSNEGDEPVHVHINKAEKNGKIWLGPKVLDEYFYGFKPSEIKEIREIVNNNSELLKNAWNEYFER